MNRSDLLPEYLQIEENCQHISIHADSTVCMSRSLLVMDGRRIEPGFLASSEGRHVLGYELRDLQGSLLASGETLLSFEHEEDYFDPPIQSAFDGSHSSVTLGGPFVQDEPAAEQETPLPFEQPAPLQTPAPSAVQTQPSVSQPEPPADPAIKVPAAPVEEQVREEKQVRPPKLRCQQEIIASGKSRYVSSLQQMAIDDPDGMIGRLSVTESSSKRSCDSLEQAEAQEFEGTVQIQAFSKQGEAIAEWSAEILRSPLSVKIDHGPAKGERWFALTESGRIRSFVSSKESAPQVYEGMKPCQGASFGKRMLYLSDPSECELFLDGKPAETVVKEDALGNEAIELPSLISGGVIQVRRNEVTVETISFPSCLDLGWCAAALCLMTAITGAGVWLRREMMRKGAFINGDKRFGWTGSAR